MMIRYDDKIRVRYFRVTAYPTAVDAERTDSRRMRLLQQLGAAVEKILKINILGNILQLSRSGVIELPS